jgi:simple sugar transport system ATP-binding protein
MNVDLRNIHKSFGPVRANVGISLSIPAGTIQGILGENGAGKSTLMKVLSGFIRADQGEILLDGRLIDIHNPADAIWHGVGMLHQDPLDFPPLRILDDFILGRQGGLVPDRKAAMRDFRELAAQFEFALDPEAYVDSLTVGERQQLEILRLLWWGVRVLIFDEPTTGISSAQKEKLFAALRLLAGQGKTILFVSHKLEDVEGLCHRTAVLRQGMLVGEAQPPYDTNKLVEMMFGKTIQVEARSPCRSEGSTLTLTDLSVEDYRLKVRGLTLDVAAGEVIGLAGMEGSGQGLFLRSVAGLVRTVGGRIVLRGRDMTGRSYHAFLRQGAAFLPAARLEEGLATGLNLAEHFVLVEKPGRFFVDWREGRRLAQRRIEDFNIHGTPTSRIESLSGGNQQRALLALLREPLTLLLLEHPTRGLDVESAIYIWSKLKERCRQGTSILFISSDLEEILQYSDRILVFFGGRATGPLDAEDLTSEMLGQLIGGKPLPEVRERVGA